MSNEARVGNPVIDEIIRRGAHGIRGNSPESAGEIRLGLVVEGGGMRGVYSGGSLVALEKLGFSDVFDRIYGESAGAINACYFLAHQGAFGIRIYIEDLPSLKFANPLRFGKMLDVGYAIDTVVRSVKPLDVSRVMASSTDLFIALTHALTGQTRLVDVKREGIPLLTLLKATGAIVPLYNHSVPIGDEPYVDGGISNPIPVEAAINAGCTHILVLLTRSPGYRSTTFSNLQKWCMRPLFSKWPRQFVDTFYERQSSRYNLTRDIVFGRTAIKDGVHIAVIGPGEDSPPLERSTVSRKKLLDAQADAFQRTQAIFNGHSIA